MSSKRLYVVTIKGLNAFADLVGVFSTPEAARMACLPHKQNYIYRVSSKIGIPEERPVRPIVVGHDKGINYPIYSLIEEHILYDQMRKRFV